MRAVGLDSTRAGRATAVGAAAGVMLAALGAWAPAAGEQSVGLTGKSCNRLPAAANDVEGATTPGAPQNAKKVGRKYLVTFYPRWFTYFQTEISPCNTLLGPRRVGPSYRAVVAINVDTVYASASVDVSEGPVIVTVPKTSTTYSVLQLDGYGQVFSGIPANKPGVYALVPQGWEGQLPDAAVPVEMPYRTTELIFRADKYVDGTKDKRPEAKLFRRSLRLATLDDYKSNPATGPTRIVPSTVFGAPFKTAADELVRVKPKKFLRQLQTALAASTTQPMTAEQQALSDRFDRLFARKSAREALARGARKGHKALVSNYLDETLSRSQWIHFGNIGKWTDNYAGYLDRSSITEYIQFGNNMPAAAYFQAFRDGKGTPLDGTRGVYTLKFRKSQIPDVSRFWSLTAYTPDTIELVRNKKRKYAVAGYTPGLVKGRDGSVTITIAPTLPKGTPEANWLPVPKGPFNVMLRAYGPQGDVADGDYTPPEVKLSR